MTMKFAVPEEIHKPVGTEDRLWQELSRQTPYRLQSSAVSGNIGSLLSMPEKVGKNHDSLRRLRLALLRCRFRFDGASNGDVIVLVDLLFALRQLLSGVGDVNYDWSPRSPGKDPLPIRADCNGADPVGFGRERAGLEKGFEVRGKAINVITAFFFEREEQATVIADCKVGISSQLSGLLIAAQVPRGRLFSVTVQVVGGEAAFGHHIEDTVAADDRRALNRARFNLSLVQLVSSEVQRQQVVFVGDVFHNVQVTLPDQGIIHESNGSVHTIDSWQGDCLRLEACGIFKRLQHASARVLGILLALRPAHRFEQGG